MKRKWLSWIAFLVLVLSGGAFAQEQAEPEIAPLATASLSIRVVAEATGEPVPEATVQVIGGQVGQTDPDGICLLDDLPARRCQVIVSKEGFATASQFVNLEPDKEASLKMALDPEGKIVGIVTSEFGEVLPDAVCSVYTSEGRIAYEKLDENGLFTLSGLSMKETYTLYVSHTEYCTKILRDVRIPEDTRLLSLEVTLDVGGVVKGKVTDSQGKPVQGARVTASSSRGAGTDTDADGMYALSQLDLQKIWIRVAAPKCAPDRREVTPTREGTAANFRLFPGRRAAGRVVDEEDKPLAKVRVRAYAGYFGSVGEMETEADGRFEFDSLPDGSVYLSFALDGYSDPGLSARSGQPDLSVTLYRAGHLLGRVVDKEGKPIPEFRVFLTPDQMKAEDRRGNYPPKFSSQAGMPVLSPKGEFEIAGVTTGAPYRLTIVTRDYAPETVSRVMGLPLDQQEAVTIAVEPGVAFSGKALDVATGSPVVGAEIILSLQNIASDEQWRSYWSRRDAASRLPAGALSCSSGEGGAFSLSNVSPRTYYITVMHPDYVDLPAGRFNFAPKSKDNPQPTACVFMPEPTEKGIEGAVLKLSKGASVSGRCYDKDGKPIVGARILLSSSKYATTNEEGAYRFDRILPGNYYVTFCTLTPGGSKWEGTYRTVSFVLKSEEGKIVDFRPFDGLTLTGKVTGDKKLRKSVRIRVQSLDDRSFSVTTMSDSSGRFAVDGLKPGQYLVSAISAKTQRYDAIAKESIRISEEKAPKVVLKIERE